jgi:steroid 5-alpha reductase family enzyme
MAALIIIAIAIILAVCMNYYLERKDRNHLEDMRFEADLRKLESYRQPTRRNGLQIRVNELTCM